MKQFLLIFLTAIVLGFNRDNVHAAPQKAPFGLIQRVPSKSDPRSMMASYPPQRLCRNRPALPFLKNYPFINWSVVKVTKMSEPYPEDFPLEKNICSAYTFVDGCKTIRYVVTGYNVSYFTTQTFAVRYIDGNLQNISVIDRTFVLREDNYHIYSGHIDKMVYAKADGTIEIEKKVPKFLHEVDGKPILVARVAEHPNQKWAIFQLCDSDVSWVVVATEEAEGNLKEYVDRYRGEIYESLHKLQINTSDMVDIDEIILPFQPPNQHSPYHISYNSKNDKNVDVMVAPKKAKGAKLAEKLIIGTNICAEISSVVTPYIKERKAIGKHCDDRVMDTVNYKHAASTSSSVPGRFEGSSSHRWHKTDPLSRSLPGSLSHSKKKREKRRYRIIRVPKHSGSSREGVESHHMSTRANDYKFTETIRIFIGTWNVNGQLPPITMKEWLSIDEEPPDIYAIGFQELDRSKEALLFNSSPKQEEWVKAVNFDLHPKSKYRKIALERLAGIMLIVFASTSVEAHIKGVDSDYVGTGILGKLGNKGGVAVRLDVYNTSICFVNSHLAAHVDGQDKRDQNYHDICSRIYFRRIMPPSTIEDHDQVYWFGDLNYRIAYLDTPTIKRMIELENYDQLEPLDQLRESQLLNRAFPAYGEGCLGFRPTYKYDIGTDNWDSSKKCRTPSWCDRILWRGREIEQLSYRCHQPFKISDHKPVSAVFMAKVHGIDRYLYEKYHEEVPKQLEEGDIIVIPTKVVFQNVYFFEWNSATLSIVNKTLVPVQFVFKRKNEDLTYCKEWLRVEPHAGLITAGNKYDITFTIHVDKKSAYQLNSGKDTLEDTLVLQTEDGKEIPIQVTGTYNHSCFGTSLAVLSRIDDVPINAIPIGELIDWEKDINYEPITSNQIPKEIRYLVEYLYNHGMKSNRLFERSGLPSDLIEIRNSLDNAKFSLDDRFNVHSVAEALLLLLDSMAEPLIPYNRHEECLNISVQDHDCDQCRQIIETLPTINRHVFLYLCTFLRELFSHADYNQLDQETVVTIFTQVFLRDPLPICGSQPPTPRADSEVIAQQALDRKKSSFMYHILVDLEGLT